MQNQNKTVVKSMEILNLFKTYDLLTLQDIVCHSGIPKSSAHRMVCSLNEMGFLQKNSAGAYSLGLLFLEFGHLVGERLDIRKLAYPIMEELKKELGEAVNLVIKDGDEALYIEKVDTTERVRVYTQIGRRAPLYAGACPRIILTFLSEEERNEYLAKTKFTRYGVNTITDLQKILDLVDSDRKRGYTVSHSELEDYSSAVAAPIFNYRGELIAGLSIVGPEARFLKETHLNRVIDGAIRGAKEISFKMGWNGLECPDRTNGC
ncbi:IclR family transcriptional regulator [Peribacillus sp. SCS-37]|uniref:IclR family transcriptional regulator n=1 Tax=Paraperibacillus esterisolvens TaxID=3115296 RepID=UPI003906A269